MTDYIGQKVCRRCGETKHGNSFAHDKSSKDGLYSYCKLCHNAYQSAWNTANPERFEERLRRTQAKGRAWREAHPEEWKSYIRRQSLLRRYGVSPEQYGLKLEEQGGHCALCDSTPEMDRFGVLHVDHDHACCGSKKGCGNCFRALLCWHHNLMLGLAKDNVTVLRKAADLLEAWAAR